MAIIIILCILIGIRKEICLKTLSKYSITLISMISYLADKIVESKIVLIDQNLLLIHINKENNIIK